MASTSATGRNRLALSAVMFAVLPTVAPVAVAAAVIPWAYGRTATTSLPLAFGAVGVLLALFSVGYLAMSRRITNAGSPHAYVAQGLGRPLGLGAAWLTLFAYGGLQIGLYGLVGAATNQALDRLAGVSAPWWIPALGAWAVVTTLGLFRPSIRGRVVAVLVGLDVLTVIGLILTAATRAGGQLSAPVLDPDALLAGAAGAALVPVLFAFSGFEAATAYAEASREPRRVVAAGMYLCLLLTVALSGGAAWAIATLAGPDTAAQAAAAAPTALPFLLADATLPPLVVAAAALILVSSLLVALVAGQRAVVRMAGTLRRERVRLGALSIDSRRGAPLASTLTLAGCGLAAIVGAAVFDLDPMLWLFARIGLTGAYALLFLLLVVSLAVVAYFAQDTRGENLWRRLIAPSLATMLLSGVAVVGAGEFGRLCGLPDSVGWALPAVAPATIAAGLVWAMILHAWRPERYRAIGLGPNSVTGRWSQDGVIARPYAGSHGLAPTSGGPAGGRPRGPAPDRAARV